MPINNCSWYQIRPKILSLYCSYFFQIHIFSREGNQVQVLLDKEKGIENPTRVRVDEEGKRLLVINKGGDEIRTYKLQTVCQVTLTRT